MQRNEDEIARLRNETARLYRLRQEDHSAERRTSS